MKRLSMEKQPPTRHEIAMAHIAKIADEMAYNIKDLNYSNAPGPDIRLINPKNGREALVEIEVTFQQQVGHQKKYKDRYDEVVSKAKKGEDIVLLVIGAKRRDLISLLRRAGVSHAEDEYGKRIFSAVSSDDQGEIRAILLRCLGDE